MSWITSGKLDAVLDIRFPRHPDEEVDLTAILNHLGKNVAEIAKDVMGEEDTEGSVGVDAQGAAEAAQNAMIASRAKSAAASELNPGQHRLARPPLRAPGQGGETLSEWELTAKRELQEREVNIDIDLRFRDIKAAVPLYSTDLSVASNALIRPIVAFMKYEQKFLALLMRSKADLAITARIEP